MNTHRMRIVAVALVVLCGTTLGLPGQTRVTRQAIVTAKTRIEAGRVESGVLLLKQLSSIVTQVRDEKQRKAFRKEIDKLLRAHDPVHRKALKAEKAAAKSLVSLVKRYRREDLPRSAMRILKQAARVRGDATDKEFALLGDIREEPSSVSTLEEWLKSHDLVHGTDEWKWSGDTVASPRLTGENITEAIASRQKVDGNFRFSVEAKAGVGTFNWAMMFGQRTVAANPTYYLAEIRHVEHEGCRVLFHRYQNGRMEDVAYSDFYLTRTERRDFVKLEIEVLDDELRATISTPASPDDAIHRLTMPRKSIRTDGAIGLFITGNSKRRDPITFRRMVIEEI